MAKVSLAVWVSAVLSFLPLVLCQNSQLVVNDPTNSTQCETINLTWQGGAPPFTIAIYTSAGSNPADAIQMFPPQQGRSVQWVVDLAAGIHFYVQVRDINGLWNRSSVGSVAASSNSTCISSSSSSPSSNAHRRGALIAGIVVSLTIPILGIVGCVVYLRLNRRRFPRSRNISSVKKPRSISYFKRVRYSITPFPLHHAAPPEEVISITRVPVSQRTPTISFSSPLPPTPATTARSSWESKGRSGQSYEIEQQIHVLRDEIDRLSHVINQTRPRRANNQKGEKDLQSLVERAKGKIQNLQVQRRSLGPIRSFEEAPPRYEEPWNFLH